MVVLFYMDYSGQWAVSLQQLTMKVALLPEEFGQWAVSLQQLTLKVALLPEEFGKGGNPLESPMQ